MAKLIQITHCHLDLDQVTFRKDGVPETICLFDFVDWGDAKGHQLRQWQYFGQLLRASFIRMYLRDRDAHYMEIHQKQLDASEYERFQHNGFHSTEY